MVENVKNGQACFWKLEGVVWGCWIRCVLWGLSSEVSFSLSTVETGSLVLFCSGGPVMLGNGVCRGWSVVINNGLIRVGLV